MSTNPGLLQTWLGKKLQKVIQQSLPKRVTMKVLDVRVGAFNFMAVQTYPIEVVVCGQCNDNFNG